MTDDIERLLELGRMDLEAGYPQYARGYFEQVLELDASNQEAIEGLAQVDEALEHKAFFDSLETQPVTPAQPGVERVQRASFEPQTSVPSVETRREQSKGVMYWTVRVVLAAVAFGALIGLMGVWGTVRTPPGSSTVTRGSGGRIGEKTTVYSDSGTTVLAAVDLDTVDEIRKANRANDTIGLMALVFDGKVLNLLNDTKVLVLDKRSGLTEVRILEGTYTYRTAWVPSECVR